MEEQKSYWGVIPGEVFHDQELTAAAKLLYLVLSTMAHRNGYCWPSNEALAAEMNLSRRRVQELISKLQKRGYIRVSFRRAGGDRKAERRYIYCGLFVGKEPPPPSGEDDAPEEAPSAGELPEDPAEPRAPACGISHVPHAESRAPSCEIPQDTHAKSRGSLIGRKDKPENIPPIVPQGTWELFERFWNAYPKKKGKDAARRAWKKLAPDMDLCRVMSEALARQKRSGDWQREGGQFIPYPATWLNGRRWEDEPDPNPSEPEGRKFGWQ